MIFEIPGYLFHAAYLVHMEWTTPVTMSTFGTGISLDFEFVIVLVCQIVTCTGKVIIFIYQPYIDMFRARLAMVAINASPFELVRDECIKYGIVFFFF